MSEKLPNEPHESIKKFVFCTETDEEEIEIVIPEVSQTMFFLFWLRKVWCKCVQ